MKNLLFLIASFIFSISAFAVKITITNPGFNFSPNDVNIMEGDTIEFIVGSIHTATEVSESTWTAQNPTPVTGFNFSSGTHLLTNLSVGTHYYVCQNHISMGMKGKITVEAATGTKNKVGDNKMLNVFPNPAKDYIYFELKDADVKSVTITSIDGKLTKEIVLNKNAVKILISDLPSNVYILSAYTRKDEVYRKEFIKE